MPESAGSSRNVDEDDMMANMLPTGFGKVVKENKNASGAGGAGDNFDAEAFAAMRKKKVVRVPLIMAGRSFCMRSRIPTSFFFPSRNLPSRR
jgi:hypothetical protein